MIELLNLYHKHCFGSFYNGLDSLLETYLDKKNDEQFSKIMKVRKELLKKDIGMKMIDNGFSFI